MPRLLIYGEELSRLRKPHREIWQVFCLLFDREVGMMKTTLLTIAVILLLCSSNLWGDKAIAGGMPNIAETASEGSPYARSGEMNLGDLIENQAKSVTGAPLNQNMATIVDDPNDPRTWVQRWELGVPDPGGTPPAGWYDVAGWEGFETFQINVIWSGNDVHLQILTDFPETGYADGSCCGYPQGGLFQLADLVFDLDLDGTWETGIPLIDHGAIPEDPRNPNPPGYGLPADDFMKGNVYSFSAWFSPQDIHYYHPGYAGLYYLDDPKIPLSWMRLGTQIGEAEITYIDLGTTHPTYRIDIILRGINASGQWNRFSIYWGTGNCANDVITGTVGGQPESIPTMNQWGLIIFALLLTLSAFWVSKRRAHLQRLKSGS